MRTPSLRSRFSNSELNIALLHEVAVANLQLNTARIDSVVFQRLLGHINDARVHELLW